MAGIRDITSKVQTTRSVVPRIYSYTTPEIKRHDGWTKIGYTEKDVEERIREQTVTSDIAYHIEWDGRAEYEDGMQPLAFKDHQFHGYLTKLGIERLVNTQTGKNTEWFHVDGPTGHEHFVDFRLNRGVLETGEPMPYELREEQLQAVEDTALWLEEHEGTSVTDYLWNAKPRFGKTLTAYAFCKYIGAKRILVLTNRPSIADSWYNDYAKFFGTQSGYYFVSETSVLAGRTYVIDRKTYVQHISTSSPDEMPGCIDFVSLQDLKGAIDFGGKYDKLSEVKQTKWDVVIVDEAHEGVDTLKTEVALSQITRRFTLHMSGTPFKAIAGQKFEQGAVFNWTYADEQKKKAEWAELHPDETNPYADLPCLNLFTYKMSDIVATVAADGIEIDGETHEYAFDLNEFFACDDTGKFLHSSDVDSFLDALCTQKKYPFSTDELRRKLKHTFWMIGGNPKPSDSARALARKLKAHPVFKDYEIILAVGDGKLDSVVDDGRLDGEKADREALARVRKAIAEHDKTITLSVGQLTTGVTVPEWTAVLMLSNMQSPALYMQAAFRAQNPCLFHDEDGTFWRKENAYVFDFDPARTLSIYEQFANDLYSDTAGGRGDVEAHRLRVEELLNFFPVLGEDKEGEMVELDPEAVLMIPRHIHAREVVRHGFMSNFLFQNIGRVFNAPKAVLDAIYAIDPYEGNLNPDAPSQTEVDDMHVNEDGEVEIPRDTVIGTAQGLFGEKVYGSVAEDLGDVIDGLTLSSKPTQEDRELDRFIKDFATNVTEPIMEAAKTYTAELGSTHRKRVEKKIKADTEVAVNKQVGNYKIERNRIERDHDNAVSAATTQEEVDAANAEYEQRMTEAMDTLKDGLKATRKELIHDAGEQVVTAVETAKREVKKQAAEEDIRKHLNGFARTIPAFLMAFGDKNTTLATFDQMVPADVFEEVTRNPKTGFCITLEQFRLFRDGGDVVNPETGEVEHFDGNLFDAVVFDDSVREFMKLREDLKYYFDPTLEHTIFDYIPNQKTNQVFTPRWVVQKMLNQLEEENPGCFDAPDATFADLYMKSGLYIAEIVTRLYNSDALKAVYPDDGERVRHILRHQVYGMAPTRIIYLIATNYILGFDDALKAETKNFVEADAAEASKNGTLSQLVDEYFG